jgi:hypothetical protein
MVFSSRRSRTGSLTMPPSGAMIGAYLPCPGAHRVRSRQVSAFASANPSGPLISTTRSTPTSHSVTSFTSAQYSATRSS